MVLKLATTFLRRTIVIQKLNNITINRLQSPRHSVLPDKWRFNTSQDWEVLGDNFNSVSLDIIPDNTLQALDFHLSPLDYLEKRVSRFVDVTNNSNLTIKPVDNGQPITDSKDKKVKKKNKHAAKKKAQLDNLRPPVRASIAGSAVLLLSRPRSPTCLLLLPTCLGTLTALSSYFVSAPVLGSSAVWWPFLVLSPTSSHLASTAVRTFKQALSDKPLRRSTSLAESLCPFPSLGLLPNKTDCKRTFDTAFINSCSLAGNHA